MAANYSYHCPYCKHHIKTTSAPVRFESPLKPCPKCSKIYVDPYSRELALIPYRPYSTTKLLVSNLMPGIGSAIIPTLIVYFVTKSDLAGWLSFGVCSVVFWLLWFFSSLRNPAQEETKRFAQWQESDQRLQNPEYAATLKKLGYNVPAQYLHPGFKPTSDPAPYQRAEVSSF